MKVHVDTAETRCQADALGAIDRVLEEQPDSVEQGLISAVQCLVRLRDATIADLRANADDAHPEAGRRLRDVNAALSLFIGAHYPLVGIQWDRLRKARDALAEVASERQNQAPDA